jgi:predicted transcriptional regulator
MAVSTSITLDDDLNGRVQLLAEARGRSPDWVLHEAITQYVDREEKREAFRQETLRVWEDYQKTGQHVTAEDADAWLARLAAGEDAEIPVCHT